jgi:hypothetical protein
VRINLVSRIVKTASIMTFRENRSRFPLAELSKYDGKWVAFSADGLRIVASGITILEVAEQLRAIQDDLQEVFYERVEVDTSEIRVGGAELL